MRKIFSFMAMAAVVLMMASCGGNEGNNPEPKNYKVEVKSVTRHEISVKVTQNDKTKYFYCDILDLKTFLDNTEKRVQTEIKTKVALAKVTNPNLKYPALLYQDFAERVFKDLTAGTDYAIFMCVVDEDYKIVGDIEYAVITTESPILGPFTVGAGKQIIFSRGNLRYNPSGKVWEFAEKQYECVGKDNENISNPAYTGWLDLFGWGTGDAPTKCSGTFGDDSDYETFTDWGDNVIRNGGNQPKLWRSLTKEEMEYLLYSRKDAETLHGIASVNNVEGYILLPDEWQLPNGLKFNAVKNVKEESSDSYLGDEWNKMEENGAVFLPKAGLRRGTYYAHDLTTLSEGYWLKDGMIKIPSYNYAEEIWEIAVHSVYQNHVGQPIRLVQDVK